MASGSYALAELALVQSRWRHPRGRVLPVKLAPTPIENVPPYLRAVTILEPQGDPVPGVDAAVARLGPGRARRRWILLGVALLAVALGGGWLWREQQRDAAVLQQSIAAARDLCTGGTYAVGWKQLEELARTPAQSATASAREDCAMAWLRNIRIRSDKQTFSEVVDPLTPVLAQGLATASGAARRRPASAPRLGRHAAWPGRRRRY